LLTRFIGWERRSTEPALERESFFYLGSSPVLRLCVFVLRGPASWYAAGRLRIPRFQVLLRGLKVQSLAVCCGVLSSFQRGDQTLAWRHMRRPLLLRAAQMGVSRAGRLPARAASRPDEESILAGDALSAGLALGGAQPFLRHHRSGRRPPTYLERNQRRPLLSYASCNNYRDLRERLAPALRPSFATHRYRVLVHAWEDVGRGLADRIAGHVFAFACWTCVSAMPRHSNTLPGAGPLASSRSITRSPRRDCVRFGSFAHCSLRDVPNVLSHERRHRLSLLAASSEPVTLLEGMFSLPPGSMLLPCPSGAHRRAHGPGVIPRFRPRT